MVRQELDKLGLHANNVELGMVDIKENLSNELKQKFRENLAVSGLELLDDDKSILVDKIKNVVVEMVHYSNDLPKVNFSDYLSKTLGYDYTYLSSLFSEVEGVTIQHFIIKHKIERAKELILYDELNLTEISHILHYSSVAHLSAQFKKVTGHTPTYYKLIGEKRRINLENL